MSGGGRWCCECGITVPCAAVWNGDIFGGAEFCQDFICPSCSNDCPSTLNVGFTIPSYEVKLPCPSGCVVAYTSPAITVSMTLPRESCHYSGSSTAATSIGTVGCETSGPTFIDRTIFVRLYANGIVWPYFQRALTPCGSSTTETPEEAGPCCGVILQVSSTFQYFSGGYVRYYWHYAFKTSTPVTDCDDECRCFNTYVDGQGHYSGTWPEDPVCYTLPLFNVTVT